GVGPRVVFVDGALPLGGWRGAQRTLVWGDRLGRGIAAASVLAKQARDGLMQRLAVRYPGYGLERHAGYGTRLHREALARLGPTPLHRLSFRGTAGVSAPGTTAGNRPAAGGPPAS
ncbi:MAG: ribonuclease HII, partial [Cyanobacteriota bacterium]